MEFLGCTDKYFYSSKITNSTYKIKSAHFTRNVQILFYGVLFDKYKWTNYMN